MNSSQRSKINRHSLNDGLTSINAKLSRRTVINNNQITSIKLTNQTLNDIYKNGIGNRIATIKANTAIKEGFIFDIEDKENLFNDKVINYIALAMTYQLAFGRGVILIVEKNKQLSEPLSKNIDISNPDVWLKTFSALDVIASNPDLNLNSINYNTPQDYYVRGNLTHKSRIIDFTYVEPVDTDKATYQYGGISEYELIYEQLVNDGVIQRSSANILERSSIPYTKKKNFNQLVQTKREGDFIDYMTALEDTKNILGQMVIDSEDDVGVLTQTLTGLSDADNIALRRLALVTGIPVPILVGESVKGLNSTGDNELEMFYTTVSNYFKRYALGDIIELCNKIGIGRITPKKPKEMTAQEEATYHSAVIDNAIKLRDLGEDYQEYLKENGIEIDNSLDSIENIFSDEAID